MSKSWQCDSEPAKSFVLIITVHLCFPVTFQKVFREKGPYFGLVWYVCIWFLRRVWWYKICFNQMFFNFGWKNDIVVMLTLPDFPYFVITRYRSCIMWCWVMIEIIKENYSLVNAKCLANVNVSNKKVAAPWKLHQLIWSFWYDSCVFYLNSIILTFQ